MTYMMKREPSTCRRGSFGPVALRERMSWHESMSWAAASGPRPSWRRMRMERALIGAFPILVCPS